MTATSTSATSMTGDDIEAKALAEVSAEAGQYIERRASTDMATWTPGEWEMFLETVGRSYLYHLTRVMREDQVPF